MRASRQGNRDEREDDLQTAGRVEAGLSDDEAEPGHLIVLVQEGALEKATVKFANGVTKIKIHTQAVKEGENMYMHKNGYNVHSNLNRACTTQDTKF